MKKIILFFLIVSFSCIAQESKVTRISLDTLHTRIDSLLDAGITDSSGISGLIKDTMTNYVNKSFSIQNITAQKNFLGNAKFGSDTSVYLGKDSLTFKKNSATATKDFIKIYPYSLAGTAPMSIFVGEYDFGGGVMDHVMGWGYQRNRYNYTEPQGYWMVEGNYFNSGNPILETFFEIIDSTGLLSWRPFQIACFRKTNYVTVGLIGDQVAVSHPGGGSFIEIYTDSTSSGYNGANSYIRFFDSTAVDFSINNYPFLFQANNVGTGTELLRLNATNDLNLLPNGNALTDHVVLSGALA